MLVNIQMKKKQEKMCHFAKKIHDGIIKLTFEHIIGIIRI